MIKIPPHIKIACLSRLSTLSLAYLSFYLINPYDSSATSPLAHWIAERGYSYEHEMAFFPGLPYLLRLLGGWHGSEAVYLLLGTLISCISFILATHALYQITLKSTGSESWASKSAVLYAIHPAGVFLSLPYTESIFALLTFLGALYPSLQLFSFISGGAMRGNGLLHAGYPLFDMIHGRISPIRGMLSVLAILSPFLAFQAYGYAYLCPGREWCDGFPVVYSFIQSHYWNNGFLRYWTVGNIPNFLIAAPVFLLHFIAIIDFCVDDITRFLTLGFKTNKPKKYPDAMLPFVYLCAFMTIYCLFFMHVQVVIRFMSSVPVGVWYLAKEGRSRIWVKGVVWGCIAWQSVGAILFGGFYPPA